MGRRETVAIAVVVRDRFSMFPRCLEALSAHTDSRVRILVVVGGADEATTDFLRDRRDQDHNLTLVLPDHPLTQAEARRCALRAVHEPFCVILENDTIVHADWLGPLLRCMHEESAAVVAPLVMWYRGIHAAGGEIAERRDGGVTTLTHSIEYGDIRRRRIGYPESHCVLLDLDRIGDIDLFDDVEPFDVDVGLTLRARGLPVFLEPQSVVTYEAPPPYERRDIPPTLLRWDPTAWAERNEAFTRKWRVAYDASAKVASYRRQQAKLALVRRHPTRAGVMATNLAVGASNRVVTALTSRRTRRSFG